jgi:hypothetical protein
MKVVLIFLSMLAISCNQDANFLHYDNPPPQRESKKTYSIKAIQNDTKVDILWVVDNSYSMDPIQQNIVNNAGLFMQEFLSHKYLNWKMGLISTDDSEDPFLGFNIVFDHTSIDQVATFQTAVNSLGVNGSASEHVFYNVIRMMRDYSYFFRNNSNVAVIMVSDEKEHSESDHGSAYSALNALQTIRTYINPKRKLRFYGALKASDLQNCPPNPGWDYGPYAGSPYEEMVTATKGFTISACVTDFGQKLAEIGKDIVKLVESPKVLLDERPVMESIKVFYKDKELPSGDQTSGGYWYYDDYYNSINFYDLSFSTDFDNDDILIEFDIDDGIDRD